MSVEPVAQPIPEPTQPTQAPQPEPVGEPVGSEFKPWKDITIALEGWEYAIWQAWLGPDVMEQDKRAKLILDALQTFDQSATMSFSESKSQPTPGTDEVFRFRFSLSGDPDYISNALLKIYETVIGMADNYKVYAGKAYAVLQYKDGTKKVVKANITKNADLDDAFETVMEQTYSTLGAKYEAEEAEQGHTRTYKFFDHWASQMDEIEEILTNPKSKDELDKAALMLSEVYQDIGAHAQDIEAGGDEFATDEELAEGKYDEFKELLDRANKIERSNVWKDAYEKFGVRAYTWEERLGYCAHCGQKLGEFYAEQSDDEIREIIEDHYRKFHPGVEPFKKEGFTKEEEEVARDDWLNIQKQHNYNVELPDGGLLNDPAKPWQVSPSYTVSHLNWTVPITTSNGKTMTVSAPVNTMTPSHYGVPLITPVTPNPATKGGEQGHYSRTPSPQQSMPEIEYASIEWCDIHNRTMKEHNATELGLDIRTLEASLEESGVPFLSEDDKNISKVYSFRDYQVGKFLEAFNACGGDHDCQAEVRAQFQSMESGRLWTFLDSLHKFFYHLDADEMQMFKERFPNLVEIMDEWASIEELRRTTELNEQTPTEPAEPEGMETYQVPETKEPKSKKPKVQRLQLYQLTDAEVDAITYHA